MKELLSSSIEDTLAIAGEMAISADKGDIIGLTGDLGAGKTLFAKGFAKALGIEEPVTSPTFTIVCEYLGGRIPLFHFDMYRIEDPDELFETGWEEYLFGEGVCLIEWADIVIDALPDDACMITIERTQGGGQSRSIGISTVSEWKERMHK